MTRPHDGFNPREALAQERLSVRTTSSDWGERIDLTWGDRPWPSIQNAHTRVSYAEAEGAEAHARVVNLRTRGERGLMDAHGRGRQSVAEGAAGAIRMTRLMNVYDGRPFLLLRLNVENTSRSPIYLHDLTLLAADSNAGGGVRMEPGRALAFFKVGWHDWVYTGVRHAHERDVSTRLGYFVGQMLFDPAVPIPHRSGEFWSEGWGILTDQKWAIVAGFVTTANQFGLVHVNCRTRADHVADFALVAPADGIRLDPGESFQSEWGYLQFVALPNPDPAAEYVQAVAREMHPRVPLTAPLKWTHWYHYFQNITEERFIANLESLARTRETVPIDTVQLDDGYQSAWGDWLTCNSKFPNGLGHLAEQIKAKSFTPGLWLAPFVVDPKSRVAREHPDWLVRDEKGRPIRSGYFYDFFGHALDMTNPAVLDHLRHLADTIAHDWGYRFIKTDFCYAGALPGKRQDPKATRAQALRRGLQAFREGIGDETVLLGCGCPFGPAIGLVDAMRIGPDTAPHWSPFLWNMPWASPLLQDERSLASLRNNLRHTLNLSTLHRHWWWNDPDCLMTRNQETRLTEAEIQSSVSLIGLHGGLVVQSDNLTRLNPARLNYAACLAPVLSPGARPLDLLEREMPELYALNMENAAGCWQVVAVMNWSDRAESRTLKFAQLGLPENRPLHVFDFWNRTYWRQTTPEILLHAIPAHGCRLLRICQADDCPRVVGDTLHITGGGELRAVHSGAREMEIEIMDLERKAQGELWFWLPQAPRDASCGDERLPIRSVSPNVYRVAVVFRGAATLRICW